jgi:hypothetical protein
MVDGDKPAMGYIYKAMDLAKEPSKEDITMRKPSICLFGILLMSIGIGSCIPPYMLLGTFLTQHIFMIRY